LVDASNVNSDMDVEDLCLSFTLPGYPDFALKRGGKKINVTRENLVEYVQLVVNMTLDVGVRQQVLAFSQGFSKVFPISDLKIFLLDESVGLLGGAAEEDWTYESKYMPRIGNFYM
jgi:E3 ubiquitin-protein ligase TRIP12